MTLAYRPDIDGLRAIAVTSVILFHSGAGFVSGGFVGVDIFFVISGYLITSLIIKEAGEGNFSFSGFFERRIRRLLPPLVPVLFVSWVGALVLLSQQQFADYSKSFVATLALSANWHFLFSVGYFDGAAETKPLLHMWSLAVEEQFYLLFPPIIIVLLRARRPLVIGTAAMLFASFTYATLLVWKGASDAAFYNSAARFWELLVGASLAALPAARTLSKRTISGLEAAGAAMIFAAITLYDRQTLFPGATALLPTIGTALIIAVGGRGGIVSSLLGSRLLVGIGQISYALYLWHWPILVYIGLAIPDAPVPVIVAGLAAATCLSIISYFFVERPFRSKAVLTTRRSALGFMAATATGFAAIALAGLSKPAADLRAPLLAWTQQVLFGADWQAALTAMQDRETHYDRNLSRDYVASVGPFRREAHRNWTCSFDVPITDDLVLECVKQQASERNVLVIGDSVGRDTTHALRLAFPEINFMMLHQSSCAPANYPRAKSRECFPGLAGLLTKLRSAIQVDAVVLAFGYRSKDWQHVGTGIEAAKALTENVMVLGVPPRFRKRISKLMPDNVNRPPLFVRKNDRSMVSLDYEEIIPQIRTLANAQGATFVNVHPFFCDEQKCSLWINDSFDQPVFWDEQHLTSFAIEAYSKFLRRQSVLRAALRGDLASLHQ